MRIRFLIAAPDAPSLALYEHLLDAALDLLPLDIAPAYVSTRAALTERVAAHEADLVLIDWELAGPDTPELLTALSGVHPGIRTVVVMPLRLRQYRQCLWEAGVCVGLPKETLDQEWLLSTLCLITRAMEREARARRDLERIFP